MKLLNNISSTSFVQQVGTTTISQIAILMLSLATASITARWLGPSGKGELAMVFMVPAVLQQFLCLGLAPANVYYTGSNRISITDLTAISVALSLLGSLIGFLLMLILSTDNILNTFLPDITSKYLIIGMLALPLGLLHSNLSAILQGLRRILLLNVINTFRAALSVLLMAVLLIWYNFGVLGAIFATLSVQFIILSVIIFVVRREGGQFKTQWNTKLVKLILSYGTKSYISNLMQFFTYRLDLFIVNYFLGPAEVGIYSVSVVIAELLWQLPNATSFVIFPKAANSSQAEMNRFTPRVFKIVFIITFFGAVGLALLGKRLIFIFFSADFLDAYIPLLYLLPGVILLGVAKILANDISGRGYPLYNSITAGFSLFVTFILDFLLIPRMGVSGAALASTFAYTLTFILSTIFYVCVSRKSDVAFERLA